MHSGLASICSVGHRASARRPVDLVGTAAHRRLSCRRVASRSCSHDRASRRILMSIEPRRRLAASACLLLGVSLLAAYAGVSSRADDRGRPRHAQASLYGGGWECSRGFRQVEETCVPIKVPPNAYLSSYGRDWECNRGYIKDDEGLGCKVVKIPANAHVGDEEAFVAGVSASSTSAMRSRSCSGWPRISANRPRRHVRSVRTRSWCTSRSLSARAFLPVAASSRHRPSCGRSPARRTM